MDTKIRIRSYKGVLVHHQHPVLNAAGVKQIRVKPYSKAEGTSDDAFVVSENDWTTHATYEYTTMPRQEYIKLWRSNRS